MENGSTETKIIKTFRTEVAFLVTLIIFVAGILAAYYALVKQQAITETKLDNIAKLLEDRNTAYNKHVDNNQKDHDLVLRMAAVLKIKE